MLVRASFHTFQTGNNTYQEMSPIIFITGATSGFGKAIATIFAKNNYRIIITGRRADRLQSVAAELKKECNAEVLPLNFDVRDKEAVVKAIASLPETWRNNILST